MVNEEDVDMEKTLCLLELSSSLIKWVHNKSDIFAGYVHDRWLTLRVEVHGLKTVHQ